MSVFDKLSKDEDFLQLFRATASKTRSAREEAGSYFASSLELPLRKTVLSTDVVNKYGIYEVVETFGRDFKYPLDLIAPGQEDEYVAYSIPNHGYIPQRRVEASDIMIPQFKIGNSIDCLLEHAEEGNPWFVRRMMEVYEAGFTTKVNADAWAVILAVGLDRNVVVYDADASAGQFTRRLISLANTTMARNGGGNGGMGAGRLTDIFISLEGMEDIRNWKLDQVPDDVRSQIYYAKDGDNAISMIHDVRIHPMYELGENQKFQNYYTNVLGGSIQGSDVELAVGLDLSQSDSFIMPVKDMPQTFDDPTLHREQKMGVYGWMNAGYGALDGRRVILLSY
jgi:hypothetical protein